MTFRYLLLPRAYSRQQFVDMASKSAFAGARIDASGIGFEVTLRKGRQALQLALDSAERSFVCAA